MRSFFAVPALAAGLLVAFAPAASAACFGTDEEAKVCVYPETVDPDGSSIDRCVWVGDHCEPVSVPVPTVTGDPVDFDCLGRVCDFAGPSCTIIGTSPDPCEWID